MPATASHSRDGGGDKSTGQLPLEEIRQQPHLRVKVGDQPAGCPSAEERFSRNGSRGTILETRGYEFDTLPVPAPAICYQTNVICKKPFPVHHTQNTRPIMLSLGLSSSPVDALRTRKQRRQPQSRHLSFSTTVLLDPREAAQSQRPSPTNPILSAWPSLHLPSSQSSRAASSLHPQA